MSGEFFKIVVVLMLALILISLGTALFHMSSGKPDDGGKMIRALGWRIGLSVGLFLLLIIGYYRGWIAPQHPHSAPEPQSGLPGGANQSQ